METVIVFDLSEVLISGLVGIEAALAAEVGLPPEELLALFSGEHQHRYFCGEISEDQYLEVMNRLIPVLSPERLCQVIRENFRRRVPDTLELAQRLARTHRVVLLSDHGKEWVEHILEIHPWLHDWPERYFSFERGLTKRQTAAFRSLAATLGVPPECCLLIDDSEVNIRLARESGWQAIHFASAEQLSQELQIRGLLPPSEPEMIAPALPEATVPGEMSAHGRGMNWESRPQRVVVAGFVHDGSELLLAKRAPRKRIAPNKFHLPGGHVEFGEHPTLALARELQEELAVAVRVFELVWVFSYVEQDKHTVGLVYRVELNGAREQLRWDEDDLAECVWVPEEHLGEYLKPDDHNYQAARAGFALLRRAGGRS